MHCPYLFVAYGAVVATFTILSLFAYLFASTIPTSLWFPWKSFFVLLVYNNTYIQTRPNAWPYCACAHRVEMWFGDVNTCDMCKFVLRYGAGCQKYQIFIDKTGQVIHITHVLPLLIESWCVQWILHCVFAVVYVSFSPDCTQWRIQNLKKAFSGMACARKLFKIILIFISFARTPVTTKPKATFRVEAVS